MRQLLTALIFLAQFYGCPQPADADVAFVKELEVCRQDGEYTSVPDPEAAAVSTLQTKPVLKETIHQASSARTVTPKNRAGWQTAKISPATRYLRMILSPSGNGDAYYKDVKL